MPIPVRSLRLEKRSSKSLDTLSGSSGEIFFDGDENTLRVYTANQSSNIVMADRTWVEENTFSGDYNDLINAPSIPGDVSQLSDNFSLLFSGDYNDLTNAPDLDGLNIDISTLNSIGDVDTETDPLVDGQVLQWNGTNWINTTVVGFQDTNTTYALTGDSIAGGAQAVLTDSDDTVNTLQFLAGTGITVTLTDTNQITIANSDTNQLSVSDLSDSSISDPRDGQSLVYNSGQWINTTPAGGLDLSSFSVTTSPAEGTGGSLTYDDQNGTFTFVPADLSTVPTLDAFSVTTDSAQAGGSLSYNNNGSFTFRPANLSGFAQLSQFSVTVDQASGGGSLSYNDQNGVFTFVPAEVDTGGGAGEYTFTIQANGSEDYLFDNALFFPGGAEADPDLYLRRGETYTFSNQSGAHPFQIQSTPGIGGNAYNVGVTNNNQVGDVIFTPAMDAPSILYYQCTAHSAMNGTIFISGPTEISQDVTPVLGGNLDANSNDILNVGTISATTYANAATGAPSITSASTIELDAPDGIILGTPSAGNIVLETILDGADTGSTKTGEWKVKLSGPYGNISGEMFEIGQTTQFGNTLTFDISRDLNTHGAVINYTDDFIIKAPTITFDTALIGENVKAATDSGTVVTIDASSTSTVYDFFISGNRTLAFTNVPTTQDRIYTFRLMVVGAVTITGATVNGTSRNPAWEGGVNSTTGGSFSEITIQMLFPGGSNPELLGSIREYS